MASLQTVKGKKLAADVLEPQRACWMANSPPNKMLVQVDTEVTYDSYPLFEKQIVEGILNSSRKKPAAATVF